MRRNRAGMERSDTSEKSGGNESSPLAPTINEPPIGAASATSDNGALRNAYCGVEPQHPHQTELDVEAGGGGGAAAAEAAAAAALDAAGGAGGADVAIGISGDTPESSVAAKTGE